MPPADKPVLRGHIVEEASVLTVTDLCRLCAADVEIIVAMVEEGILHVVEPVQPIEPVRPIEPAARAAPAGAASGDAAAAWRFSGHALRRARIALRLQRDLEINLAGAALALDLIEEIEQLRRLRFFGR